MAHHDGCASNGECSVATLVHRHSVDNTVVVTFGNARQAKFTENWVYHLRKAGVGGLLVGMMNMQPLEAQYVKFAGQLRNLGVGVYTVNSPEVARQPQGGRWFHVLPLLRTGARVLLSDSDVVWLRDPRPWLKRLEAAHPLLDFAVSSDAQGDSDGQQLPPLIPDPSGRTLLPTLERAPRKLRRRRHLGKGGGRYSHMTDHMTDGERGRELDIERFSACGASLNIGILAFPPGLRPGSLRAISEAVAHLTSEGNLARVDQGPINFRWKHGAGKAPGGSLTD